eukprot:scaffold986_cov237-Pinguiococcus_pyrenoidosus.AAC.12
MLLSQSLDSRVRFGVRAAPKRAERHSVAQAHWPHSGCSGRARAHVRWGKKQQATQRTPQGYTERRQVDFARQGCNLQAACVS